MGNLGISFLLCVCIALISCGWVDGFGSEQDSASSVMPIDGEIQYGGQPGDSMAPPRLMIPEHPSIDVYGNFDYFNVPNNQPIFTKVEVEDGTVSVSVFDLEGDEIDIEVTQVPGMSAYPFKKTVIGSGTASFQFVANQEYIGEEGVTTISISDGGWRKSSEKVTVAAYVPKGFVIWSEYERWFRLLKLNMDFSLSERVKLMFSGPGWMTVQGGNEQIISGGWSSRTFEVILDNSEENLGTLNIRAISVDEDGKWSSSGNRYESLVEIVRPLFISSITYDYVGHEVIVEIDAEDEARLNLSSTISNGIQGYEFHLDPDNPNLFTSYVDYSNSLKLYGDAEVTVTDQYANADVESTKVQHESVGIIDNRIYAYFEKAQTSTWEDVLLIVTTGKLSHPFQFILGVGLVLDEDAQYVAKSFNIGVPGAEFDYPDGIWAGVDPFTFILAPDGLIGTGANPEDSLGTKGRFDFNVSPLAGHDIQGASGDLFNIKVKYSEPGVKTLTFQQFNGVNRTYFSAEEESQNEDRFWEDCSNWHPGLQTSIIVE